MCYTIASQFVRDDFSGSAARFQKTLKEAFRCLGVSSPLQIDIYNFAILIDCTPEVVLFATNLHEYFVQVVGVTKTLMLSLQAMRKFWTEFVHPKSYRFVTDINVSFSQQIFDISNTEIEAVVEPNRILDG